VTVEPRIEWALAARTDDGLTLSVPVSFASSDWRDEFKRAVARQNLEIGVNGWGEILLIGDRLVIKNLSAADEPRLRAVLGETVGKAHRAAVQVERMRETAREELKLTLFRRERSPRSY
jgi:hypothetical protein